MRHFLFVPLLDGEAEEAGETPQTDAEIRRLNIKT